MPRALSAIAATALLGCVSTPPPFGPIQYSVAANGPPPYEIRGECSFALGSAEFRLEQSGKGRRTVDSRVTDFAIELLEGEWIEALSFASYEGDVILFLSVTDGEYGSSQLVRLDGEALFAEWSNVLPAFNLSIAAIESEAIYVGAIGLVTRIDAESGRFEWLHGNLYDFESGHFNSFMPPEVGPTCVVFREVPEAVAPQPPRAVGVDKDTGERLTDHRMTRRCS